MDSIASFYNNLFAIEITVFGIIAAAILVFLQIVYSQFSHREVNVIFRNTYFLLYLIISTLTLLITAIGSLISSFPKPDFLSQINIYDIFRSEKWALILLLSFLFSLGLFVAFTVSNIRFIRPSRIALLISKKVKQEKIKEYLLRKYGVPAPNQWPSIKIVFKRAPDKDSIINLQTNQTNGTPRLLEKESEEIQSEKRQEEKKFAENKDQYEKIKIAVAQVRDPLEPLDALTLRAINTSDFTTLNELQSILFDISSSFINANRQYKDLKEWSPYSGILEKFFKYLTGLLKIDLDMCDRQRLDSAKIIFLETTERISGLLAEGNYTAELKILLAFYKEVADAAIGKSPQVFNRIIQSYKGLADYAFENGIETNRGWLDEIFCYLGWLGERLINRQGIEQKPLMRDDYYSNEYDQLFSVLLSYRYEYNEKYPTSYPLIYFDAIDVVFLQLLSVAGKTTNGNVKNNIFECIFVYSSFAEAAMLKGNSDGAALAIIRLKVSYEKLVRESLGESAKQAICELVRIGGTAASNKNKLSKSRILDEPIDEYAMNIIEVSPFRSEIAHEVFEVYIKASDPLSNVKAIWEYVKALGKRMGTNFGFMFDWNTGELYPENDPRRK